MRRIKSKDTTPEWVVRRLVHSMGFRYRLHAKDLPGKPDSVFRARKAVIFVHGCFWHLHEACPEGRIPSSNSGYWAEKLNRNVFRDKAHRAALRKMGWRVLEIWECEIKGAGSLRLKIQQFLDVH
jgi:DNA mismatch endonuclease (patch repair protein)